MIVPAGRRAHVLRLWLEYLTAGSREAGLPSCDRWLATAFRREKHFGSRDRRWYSSLIFDSLRLGVLASFCRVVATSNDPLNILFATFCDRFPSGASFIEDWRQPAVAEDLLHWVESLRSSLVSGECDPVRGGVILRVREWLAQRDNAAVLLGGGLPPDLWRSVSERACSSGWSTADMRVFVARQAERSPGWLRVSAGHAVDDVAERLRDEGIQVVARNASLVLLEHQRIVDSKSYRTGLVDIQDLASQGVVSSLEVKTGDLVWDACAGGGGKTMSLAERAGWVWASDVRSHKERDFQERSARLAVKNVTWLPWNGNELPALPREVIARGGFDCVVADAPCSGSGTWRRAPEGRFTLRGDRVSTWCELQLRILQRVAQAVRPGGTLVYATCSWFCQENENVVSQFLSLYTDFSLQKNTLLGNPNLDSDTLFISTLKRK